MDEAEEQLGDVVRRQVLRGGDPDRGGGRERPREHRQAAMQGLFLLGQQPIAPLHRLVQALPVIVAGTTDPRQPGRVGPHLLGDLGQAERTDPSGGQLDRQRDAVQRPTDLGHGVQVVGVEDQLRVGRPGALHEQVDGGR